MARMTVEAPATMSPPAKTPLRVVLLVHDERAVSRDREALRRLGDERVGSVADGFDDDLDRQLLVGSFDRDRAAAPLLVGLAELASLDLQRAHPPLLIRKDLDGRVQ